MTRRTVFRVAAAAIALLGAGVISGYLWLRSSLPQEDGGISLAGLDHAVQILRDNHGIPLIRAQSERDAYFALGFVHAQDRLWQMDFMRRAGAGRLAEILGQPGLRTDRLMRTLGLYRLAEAELAGLDAGTRAAFEAYAAGVNAFLAKHEGAWPIEYYVLRTRPWEWRPADSLVWGRLMALRLSADFRSELLRARLLKTLTPSQIEDLWPNSPESARRAASLSGEALPALAAVRWDAIPQMPPPASASNSLAVSGAHSASGKPLLANDPHLALEAPDLWYLARIEAPGLTLAGGTVPGIPFMVLGHNAEVAWGFSSSEVDSQDLFIERVSDADPSRYVTPDGSLPFITRDEIIKVRGGADVVLKVRETRHGPVISDAVTGAADIPVPAGGNYVVALADAGLRPEDRTPDALYGIDHAKSVDDMTAALSHFDTPPQNIVYADKEGAIALYSVGRVPLRKRGVSLYPVPGWSGEYDWTGLIPFSELPHSLNPASGFLVTANNRWVGDDYPYPLAAYWPASYRARRIAEMFDDLAPLSPAEAAAMQLDTESVAARDLLPRLLAVPAHGAQGQAARKLLSDWDGDMRRDQSQPLIYSAWLLELGNQIVERKLGAAADSAQVADPMVLGHLLRDAPQWCDDPATAAIETCDDAIAASLDRALARLSRKFGNDPGRWQWGAAHRARFHHAVLGNVPLLDALSEVEIATGGDDSTVNRGTFGAVDSGNPFVHIHGPGLRAVYDLSDLDGALFMIAPGESGNPLSPHYRDFAYPWREGQYLLLSGAGPSGSGTVPGFRQLTLTPEGR